jgi:hypothetical protein
MIRVYRQISVRLQAPYPYYSGTLTAGNVSGWPAYVVTERGDRVNKLPIHQRRKGTVEENDAAKWLGITQAYSGYLVNRADSVAAKSVREEDP